MEGERFGTEMYDNKYSTKEEIHPRSVVTYFVDKYMTGSQRCLDLGSGAGRHSKYIAEKGIGVTAIDLSEMGVRNAKEVLKDFPDSHVLIGDVHKLPFVDGSFDSLVCNRVLDYNDDEGLEVSFSEIERVLEDGGLVLLTVRSVSQEPKKEEALVSENEDGGKSFRVGESQEVQHYFTEEEIRDLASRHNFVILEMREDSHTNSEGEAKSELQAILRKMSQPQE